MHLRNHLSLSSQLQGKCLFFGSFRSSRTGDTGCIPNRLSNNLLDRSNLLGSLIGNLIGSFLHCLDRLGIRDTLHLLDSLDFVVHLVQVPLISTYGLPGHPANHRSI